MEFAPRAETVEVLDAQPTRKPYTALDFIADQLRAANPGGDWDSNGIDRARELGAILLRNKIVDLSKLGATKVIVTFRAFPWADPETREEIALTYDGVRFGYLGTPTEPAREPFLQNYVRVAWSAEGHGHIDYLCRFTPQGFYIVPQWGSSSDWVTFREAVRFFVSVYLMYLSAGTASGAGATVGTAIVGASFAASFPLLTTILGNIAIGAYFSGGDVKGTVKGALIAQFAGGLGDIAGAAAYTATQIEILARLADVAVTALVRGQDVEKAVTQSLLMSGFTSVGEMLDAIGEPKMGEFDTVDVSGYPVEGDVYSPDPVLTVDAYGSGSGWGGDIIQPLPGESGGATFVPFAYGADLPPVTFDPGAPVEGFGVPSYTPQGERIATPVRTTDTGPAVSIVNTVSSLALNALKLNQAWNQARNPAPNTQARTVSGGAVVSGNDAGVIITRRADGTVSTSRPPVGVPQATTSGNFIVNNGDGTYTLIASDGSRRTVAYGQNSGPEQSALPWPLMLAGAGLLISVFK